jgi:soluble cytochrome b562
VITAAIFALNAYTTTPAQADTDQLQTTAERAEKGDAAAVNQGLTDVENSTNDVEKLFDDQRNQILDLQKQLEQRQVLQNRSDYERKAFSDSLNVQIEMLDAVAKNWKEYKGNVHAFVAETKARKYLPWGYALVALALFKRDTVQDTALVGLAGYGTGALIEQTGYGLAHIGVKTLVKLGHEF